MRRLIAQSLLFAGLFFAAVSILPACADAEPPIEAFTRLPNLSGAQLSPDGERLAVLMPVEGKRALVVMPMNKESGIKPQVANAGDWEIASFFWKTDQEIFAQLSRTRRRKGTQPYRELRMIRYNIETQKLTEFLNGDYATRKISKYFVVDTMPQDPEHILLAVNGSLEKIGLSDESRTHLTPGPFLASRWFVDAHDVPRAVEETRNDSNVVIYYRIGEDNELIPIAGLKPDSPFRFWVVGVADDPTHLIMLSDHEGGVVAAYEYDPVQRKFLRKIAAAPGRDIDDPIYRDGHLVGFAQPRPIYLDPEAAALQKLVDQALPDTTNEIVQITPNHRFGLVRAYDKSRPTALYKLTCGDKKKLDLIGADYPELEGLTLAPVKAVQYAARDGQKIEAILTLPAGRTGPLSFVVLPHGGPTTQDVLAFDYWTQFLASRGYGVLQPNFRGSTGYGRAFQKSGLGQWGGVMQNDVDDGAQWLIQQKLALPGRICIVGGSYGGYVALFAATGRPDLYRCAAAWAPVTDIGDLIYRLSLFDYKDPNIPIIGKEGEPDPLSPAHRADKAAMPILIGHGEEDYTVPVEQTRTMEAALKKAGKPAEVVYYKDENHYLSLGSTRLDFFKRLDAFLARNIGTQAAQ